MTISKNLTQVTLFLGLTLPICSVAATTVTEPVHPGTKITLTGIKDEKVRLYVLSRTDPLNNNDRTCTNGDRGNWKFAKEFKLMGTAAEVETLDNALGAGDLICAINQADVTDHTAKLSVVSVVPSIEFTGDIVPGMHSIPILLNTNATVTLFKLTKDYKTATDTCTQTDVDDHASRLTIGSLSSPYTAVLPASASSSIVQLQTGPDAGATLCLSADPTTPGQPFYSKIVTVASARTSRPTFVGQLVGGKSSLYLDGTGEDSIQIFQVPASPVTVAEPKTCENRSILEQATLLQVATTGSSTTANSYQIVKDAKSPFSVALVNPLVADTQLCLVEIDKTGAKTYSELQQVIDLEDYDRVRLDFTAGTIISNQQQTSGQSSTASTYIDLGFNFNNIRPGGSNVPLSATRFKPYHAGQPGLDLFFDLRLSAIPVATKTTTLKSGDAAPSTDLNVLSSQQGFVVFGGLSAPWRLTHWKKSTNAFVMGPVVRAGIATLLNPSLTSTKSTGSTTEVTTAKFDSVYSYHTAGIRVGWSEFPASTDKAPKPWAQLDMTIGSFSNLPSYICRTTPDPTVKVAGTVPTNTGCFTQSVDKDNNPTYTTNLQTRSLIPRIQGAGFIKLPNYPFVLGFDANLAQYAFGAHVNHVDPLNKPANDVRIYVGATIDPITAFKKLGAAK